MYLKALIEEEKQTIFWPFKIQIIKQNVINTSITDDISMQTMLCSQNHDVKSMTQYRDLTDHKTSNPQTVYIYNDTNIHWRQTTQVYQSYTRLLFILQQY